MRVVSQTSEMFRNSSAFKPFCRNESRSCCSHFTDSSDISPAPVNEKVRFFYYN